MRRLIAASDVEPTCWKLQVKSIPFVKMSSTVPFLQGGLILLHVFLGKAYTLHRKQDSCSGYLKDYDNQPSCLVVVCYSDIPFKISDGLTPKPLAILHTVSSEISLFPPSMWLMYVLCKSALSASSSCDHSC